MAKSTTSREFAHEDLAVLPGVGGDHEMTQRQAPVNHYLSLCLGARCGPPRLSGSDSRCFMRSSCTASGPANARYGDRTRDLPESTGSLRQCFDILPRALSGSRAALCALRSTVPAHAGCPHTVPAHNGPSLPCTSRLQCRCILRCKGARTRALSSRPPRGFLGARARSFSCTQAAARGSACPHPGPLQLRLLVLLKCNSFNRNTVLRDGRPKIGMTATPSRNRNRKHPAGTGP